MNQNSANLTEGAGIKIDIDLVPSHLQHLIPMAQRWSFSKGADQDAFVGEMLKHRQSEVSDFNAAIDEARIAIVDWHKSQGFAKKNVNEITDDDWGHPSWVFMRLLKIRELTGPSDVDKVAEEAAKKAFAVEMRERKFNAAMAKADDLFRSGKYSEYMALLSPFEEMLSGAQKTKMKIAKNKVAT